FQSQRRRQSFLKYGHAGVNGLEEVSHFVAKQANQDFRGMRNGIGGGTVGFHQYLRVERSPRKGRVFPNDERLVAGLTPAFFAPHENTARRLRAFARLCVWTRWFRTILGR